jgi:hypothetical protein
MSDTPCTHERFHTDVAVIRIEETQQLTTDIRVHCEDCGMPFRWLGLKMGSHPSRPMVSVDGLELRAPIAPADQEPSPMGGVGFEIQPRSRIAKSDTQ